MTTTNVGMWMCKKMIVDTEDNKLLKKKKKRKSFLIIKNVVNNQLLRAKISVIYTFHILNIKIDGNKQQSVKRCQKTSDGKRYRKCQ